MKNIDIQQTWAFPVVHTFVHKHVVEHLSPIGPRPTHRRRRRDSTVESRVGGVNAPVGSRDPVYNFCTIEPITVRLLRLVTSDDIMTSLLKKLLISIKIHIVKPLCLVSKLSTESSAVVVSCELCSHRRRDATRATVESRRRCVRLLGFTH